MVGTKDGYDAPPLSLAGEGELLVVGDRALDGPSASADPRLGGSEYLTQFGGSDRYPGLPERPAALVGAVTAVANRETTLATHDASHGGLAVTLAEMVHDGAGATVSLPSAGHLFHEQPGRVVVETTNPAGVREAFEGVAPVVDLGAADGSGALSLSVDGTELSVDAATVAEWRGTIGRALE
ncbi:MAG: AIR synthase-related protein, partial [Haloarculaceae archaeon]